MHFTIIVPEKVSLNTALRRHNATLTNTKRLWSYLVLKERNAGRLAAYEGSFPVDIEFHYHFESRAIDSTNCGFMSKALEDALVANGIIPDDNTRFIRKSINWSDKAQKGKGDMVIVTLSPAV